jgi:YaiO family outer membrane protein
MFASRHRRPAAAFSSVTAMAVAVLLCTSVSAAAQAQTARPPSPPRTTLDLSNTFTAPDGSVADQNETSLKLTHKVNLRTSLVLGVDQYNKYSDLDTAVTVGLGHAFGGPHLFLLSGSASFGFNDPIIAKTKFDVSGLVRVNSKVSPLFELEYSTFAGTTRDIDVAVVTAGLSLTPHARINIKPVFVYSHAAVTSSVSTVGQTFGWSSSFEVSPKVSLTFAGGAGHEHALVRTLTIYEVINDGGQINLQPGVEFKIGRREHVLGLGYSYEHKKSSYAQHGFTVSFSASF